MMVVSRLLLAVPLAAVLAAGPAFADVTVKGKVQWSFAGIDHPAPHLKIEIRDDEGSSVPSDVVKTVFTDAGGNYTTTVDNNDGIGQGGRDIFVRVVFETDSGSRVDEGRLPGFTYSKDSPIQEDVADGSVIVFDYKPTPTASDDESHRNGALSILYAVTEAEMYLASLDGRRPAGIDTNYPVIAPNTFYSGLTNSLNVVDGHEFAWDAVLHEYGHYVAATYGLANPALGRTQHSLDDNLAEFYAHKGDGNRTAWSEGLANYFAILVQISRGHKALGLPGVGDDVFGDLSAMSTSASLEGPGGLGEDNELSVAQILYDLYDSNAEPSDQVALGAGGVWRTILAASPDTLSEAWNAFAAGGSVEYLTKLGAVFTEHHVAPEPTDPAPGAVVDSATVFKWKPYGNGMTYALNEFWVEFYTPDLLTHLFTRGGLTTPEYNPDAADRAMIQRFGPAKWIVRGSNTASPATGQYVSPPRSLGGVRLGFVIDDTGSMGEEIGAVRDALTRFVASLAAEPTPPGIGVITFEDAPALRVASNDLGRIQAAVDGLSAGGGGECPEASAEALGLAGDTVAQGGVVFFASDADPHPGSDVAGAISALRGRRVRTNVLASGSCSEDVMAATIQPRAVEKPGAAALATLAPGGPDDDHGNSAAEATPTLPAKTALIGRVDPAGDRDYLSFAASAGTSYRIATEGSEFDTVLTVYDTDGTTQVAFDDDGGSGSTSLLVFTPTVSGTYFVAVAGYSSNTGFFQLVIEPNPPPQIALGAIQAYSQVAAETGGVFAFIPGINTNADDARRYASAARDIMAGAVGPSIPLVEPATVPQGAVLVLTVHGLSTNFSAATTVAFGVGGIIAGTPIVRSATTLEVPVEVTAATPIGFSDVTVTTPLGAATELATGHDALRVAATGGASITAIVPSMLTLGATADVRVFGVSTHFDATSTLNLGTGVTLGALTAVSPTELRASVAVGSDPSALGFHDVSVTTGSEVAGESVPGPLLVVRRLADIPRLTSVTPNEGRPGQALTLHVTGENTHFAAGSVAEFSPAGIRVVATRVLGPTSLDLDVQVDPAAALGFRDLTLRTGGETAVGLGTFAVTLETTAITTTTTLPPAGCTSEAECTDDDPCTRTACVARQCVAETATGFDGVLCAFDRSLAVPACGGQVPAAVGKKFAKARALVAKAASAAKPKKGQKLLKQTRVILKAALKDLGKAAKKKGKGQLSAECAAALRAVVTGAQGRVAAFRF